MNLALLVLPLLAAAPERTPKLAAFGLDAADVSTEKASFFADALNRELEQAGVAVTSSREIQAVLGIERQKQLLGCSTDSCIAELSGALGVDAVLIGSVARLDTGYGVNLKLVDARSGKSIGSWSKRAANDNLLLDAFADAGQTLSGRLRQHLGLEPLAKAPPPREGGVSRVPAFALLGVGAVALVAGGTSYGLARAEAAKLQQPGLRRDEYDQVRSQGQTLQTAGFGLGAVGLVAAGAGAILLATSGSEAAVALVPSSDAFAVAFGGQF